MTQTTIISRHTTRSEARDASRNCAGSKVVDLGRFARGSFGLYVAVRTTPEGTVIPDDRQTMRVWAVVR